jgi:hypothetical protein
MNVAGARVAPWPARFGSGNSASRSPRSASDTRSTSRPGSSAPTSVLRPGWSFSGPEDVQLVRDREVRVRAPGRQVEHAVDDARAEAVAAPGQRRRNRPGGRSAAALEDDLEPRRSSGTAGCGMRDLCRDPTRLDPRLSPAPLSRQPETRKDWSITPRSSAPREPSRFQSVGFLANLGKRRMTGTVHPGTGDRGNPLPFDWCGVA